MELETNVSRFLTYAGGVFILSNAIISAPASATSPPRELSDYSPSLLLSKAATTYDDCVRAEARKYASQPEATPFIVERAEQACQRQFAELEDQGRQDSADPASKIPDLRRQVELFIGQSTAATRVSGFAEVGMIRQPPIEVR